MGNIFKKNKKLTNRQIECLEVLTNIYLNKNEPIHYTELAPLLKVSKWSTYDMLKLLEKKNLIKPVYKEFDEDKSSKKGRRAVFFVPSMPLINLDNKKFKSGKKKDELSKRKLSIHLNSLPKVSPKLYCISFLTAIGMLYLESFHEILPIIKNYVISLSQDPKSTLLFIAYTSVGAVIGNLRTTEAKKKIENDLNQYKNFIENMNEESLKEILDTILSLIESNK